MTNGNQKNFDRLRAFVDLIVLVGAYFLTYVLFFFVFPENTIFGGTPSGSVTSQDYMMAILYIAPLHMILYWLVHLYRPMRVTGRRIEALRIFEAKFNAVKTQLFFKFK